MAHASLIGQTFGNLTVCDLDFVDKHQKTHWICLCQCAVFASVSGRALISGATRSCGCLKRAFTSLVHRKHGHSRNSRTYKAWQNAKARCSDPSLAQWEDYGGRGIKMCSTWATSFDQFLADMGPCPPGQQIDRINNSGHYEPGNCRWSTRQEQARNRRDNRLVTIAGETKLLVEWCSISGIARKTLSERLDAGWPDSDLLTPANRNRSKHKH